MQQYLFVRHSLGNLKITIELHLKVVDARYILLNHSNTTRGPNSVSTGSAFVLSRCIASRPVVGLNLTRWLAEPQNSSISLNGLLALPVETYSVPPILNALKGEDCTSCLSSNTSLIIQLAPNSKFRPAGCWVSARTGSYSHETPLCYSNPPFSKTQITQSKLKLF